MTEALLVIAGLVLLVSTGISISQWFKVRKAFEDQRRLLGEYHELIRSNERVLRDLHRAVEELSKEDAINMTSEDVGSDEGNQ